MHAYFMPMLIALRRVMLFLVLTILTQIGGLVYLIAVIFTGKFLKAHSNRLVRIAVFLSFYCISTIAIMPVLSERKALPILSSKKLAPVTVWTCLLNRHYVDPKLHEVISQVADESDFTILYMDANFPFFDGFPLLPHLSHDDGKKLDIAFQYVEKESGQVAGHLPTFIGYGSFEVPLLGEQDQPTKCGRVNPLYSITKIFPVTSSDVQFSPSRTRDLIEAIVGRPEIKKVFIEPHLKSRMRLTSSKIRFHGCHAVRHDDHIHIEL